MKKIDKFYVLALILLILNSCLGDIKEKYNEAKNGISINSALINEAQKIEDRIDKLTNTTPLTNEELKDWLPINLGAFKRQGFKVGKTAYANVASIQGTYNLIFEEELDENLKPKLIEKKCILNITDGAGPTGGIMISALQMAVKMDIEEENELKHLKPVTKNGIRAQETYFKNKNSTELQFVYKDRFGVTIQTENMIPEETWQLVEKLNLEALIK